MLDVVTFLLFGHPCTCMKTNCAAIDLSHKLSILAELTYINIRSSQPQLYVQSMQIKCNAKSSTSFLSLNGINTQNQKQMIQHVELMLYIVIDLYYLSYQQSLYNTV